MKQLWNSFRLAFSMYSILPYRRVVRKNRKNMKYLLCFVPLIGVIISLLVSGWAVASPYLLDHDFLRAVICVMIAIIFSGAAYLDGFFRTTDALCSHKSRTEKLEILTDSHSGYFAIITCVCYFFIIVGIWTEMPLAGWSLVSKGFIISRAIYGLSIIWMRHSQESKCTLFIPEGFSRIVVSGVLLLYIIVCAFLMLRQDLKVGLGCLAGALIAFLYYFRIAYRHFGGTTEDIAGFFVQVCEIMIPLMALLMYRGSMDLVSYIEEIGE